MGLYGNLANNAITYTNKYLREFTETVCAQAGSGLTRSSRRMPGHIREFNRLELHSSHDLVFKIWWNNKTEATFGVFCL